MFMLATCLHLPSSMNQTSENDEKKRVPSSMNQTSENDEKKREISSYNLITKHSLNHSSHLLWSMYNSLLMLVFTNPLNAASTYLYPFHGIHIYNLSGTLAIFDTVQSILKIFHWDLRIDRRFDNTI